MTIVREKILGELYFARAPSRFNGPAVLRRSLFSQKYRATGRLRNANVVKVSKERACFSRSQGIIFLRAASGNWTGPRGGEGGGSMVVRGDATFVPRVATFPPLKTAMNIQMPTWARLVRV